MDIIIVFLVFLYGLFIGLSKVKVNNTRPSINRPNWWIKPKNGNLDIGVWSHHKNSVGIDILNNSSNISGHEILDKLNGYKQNNFTFYSDKILKNEHCDNVIQYIEKNYDLQSDDFKLEISKEVLIKLIGINSFQNLSQLFNDRIDEIKIRRVKSTNNVINFHKDHALKTLQVSLNGDDNYVGGKLIFISKDGKVHKLNRKKGSLTIHDNTIPHGVSKLVSGVRFGLFFLKQRLI